MYIVKKTRDKIDYVNGIPFIDRIMHRHDVICPCGRK